MMLSKELLDIIKKQSFEIFVDSVGVRHSVFVRCLCLDSVSKAQPFPVLDF
jgi:hypothetical protein